MQTPFIRGPMFWSVSARATVYAEFLQPLADCLKIIGRSGWATAPPNGCQGIRWMLGCYSPEQLAYLTAINRTKRLSKAPSRVTTWGTQVS